MTELATIEPPPAPWVNVPASVMSDGTLVEVVRLADVVRWLMKVKRLHFVPAVRVMHEALAGFAGLSLYLAGSSGVVRAVGGSDAFGLDGPKGRRIFSPGIGKPPAPAVQPQPLPEGVTSGPSAALHFVRHVWGCGLQAVDVLDRQDLAASFLVMPCDQAAQLWGCTGGAEVVQLRAVEAEDAEPKTWAQLVTFRELNKGAKWTVGMKKILSDREATEGKKLNSKGVRKAMAGALGVSDKRVGELIREIENPPKNQKSNVATHRVKGLVWFP